MNRAAIKLKGKEKFKQQYGISIGIFFIYLIIVGVISFISGENRLIGFLISLFVTPIISIGLSFTYLKVYRGEQAEVGNTFSGFSNYAHNFGGSLWMSLWVFLWSLLLVIPGIIKGYSYCMTPYILMDQPDIEVRDALKLSMEMTKGHKMDIFIFDLSYIGWYILSIFTLGLLVPFYVGPYCYTAKAGIYEELKGNKAIVE